MLKFLLSTDAREEEGQVQLSRIISTINLNTRQKYSRILTGETQLRARRTRLKILRAIAEKNGSAGFSDIRNATGLSTGSIYYHLERMGNYIIKDSKHYLITDEGLQLLRKIDDRFSSSSSPTTRKKDEGSSLAPRIESEETMKKSTGI